MEEAIQRKLYTTKQPQIKKKNEEGEDLMSSQDESPRKPQEYSLQHLAEFIGEKMTSEEIIDLMFYCPFRLMSHEDENWL